jgi:membrane fusion protein (multidrug efflux system)
VRFEVAAYPGQSFTGTVKFSGARVRRETRDLVVEAMVPNSERRLRPGMFAIAKLVLGRQELPAVPTRAIRSDAKSGGERVFVVEGGRLEERLVQTGPNADGWTSIRAGLRAGERVALVATPELKDGLGVR